MGGFNALDPDNYAEKLRQDALRRYGLLPSERANIASGDVPATGPELSPQQAYDQGVPVNRTKTAQMAPPTDRPSLRDETTEPIPQLTQYDAPAPTQDNYKSSFEVFKNPLIALGVLGTAFSKRGAINAMTFATGAMNGYREGQTEQFEQNKKNFDEQMKAVIEQNRVEQSRYKAAWDMKTELDNEKFAKAYTASVQNNDPLGQALLKAHKFQEFMDLQLKREAASEAAQKVYDAQEARDAAKETEIARLKETPRVKQQAEEILNYRQPMPPAYRQSPELTAIREIVNERSAKAPAGQEFQQTGYGERNKAAQVMASGNGQGGRIISLNTAIRHFQTLDRLADALGNKDYKLFNQWRQTIAEQRGQPDVTNYDLAADIVSKEIVKSLVANGGGQTERSEIEAQFSHDHSPQALHGLVQTGRELLGSQFMSVKLWANAHYAGDVFERGMDPEARRVLEHAASQGDRPAVYWVRTPQEAQQLDPGTHYRVNNPDGTTTEFVR
jgi:hypothetical protein